MQNNKVTGIHHAIGEVVKRIRTGKGKRDQWIIALLFGVLLLVIALPSGRKMNAETNADKRSGDFTVKRTDTVALSNQNYIAEMERKLADFLSQTEGCGKVDVMITLKESAQVVPEKDRETSLESSDETDGQGSRTTKSQSTQESTIYSGEEDAGAFARDGGSERAPFVSKEIAPRIEGVVVAAQGGDHPVVVQNITEIVQALFGVDTHKIRIVKRE